MVAHMEQVSLESIGACESLFLKSKDKCGVVIRPWSLLRTSGCVSGR